MGIKRERKKRNSLIKLMAIKVKKMKKYFISILILLFAASCNSKMQTAFNKEFIHAGTAYSKAVVVNSGNVRTVYVAGLTGDGADFEAQTRSAFNNIKIELEAAGATLKDIVKMNTYIVEIKNDRVDIFRAVRKEILGEKEMPASTIVGISALASKEKLIEIEAVAVIKK